MYLPHNTYCIVAFITSYFGLTFEHAVTLPSRSTVIFFHSVHSFSSIHLTIDNDKIVMTETLTLKLKYV